MGAAAGALGEEGGAAVVEDATPVLAPPQGLKFSYDRYYEGNGRSPGGPLRGSEAAAAAAAAGDGSSYVDGGAGQSVDDLAAQLSSLQSFQF